MLHQLISNFSFITVPYHKYNSNPKLIKKPTISKPSITGFWKQKGIKKEKRIKNSR